MPAPFCNPQIETVLVHPPAHNLRPGEFRIDLKPAFSRAHTWPDHLSDQIGLMVTVEQGHCTLAAVKRYWDTHVLADGIIFSSDLLWSSSKEKNYIRVSSARALCLWQPATDAETHNTETRILLSNSACNASHSLTWPGREFDQKGTAPSVEQGHCTLIAVKRYRDPPRIGGRHNFLLRPLRSSLKQKT